MMDGGAVSDYLKVSFIFSPKQLTCALFVFCIMRIDNGYITKQTKQMEEKNKYICSNSSFT